MNPKTPDSTRISPRALRLLVISSLFGTAPLLLHGAEAAKPAEADKPAPTTQAAGEKKADAKEPAETSLEAAPGEFSNSVTIGMGSYFVDGDKSQFQRQIQRRSGVYGGLEELHYEHSVGKKGALKVDGRAIGDNHDYGLKLDLSHPDIGFVRFGYDEFRTWYDGSGGYSPTGNAWASVYDDNLFVDRRKTWIEAGLNLPKWPVFTVRYTYDAREGQKDSTIWGDYNLTQNPATPKLRGIAPTFLDLDESRHIFEADVRHTLGKTAFSVGLRYEQDAVDNSRNLVRRAGEATQVRTATQTDSTDADFFNVHASTETRFNPKLQLSTGYSFTQLDTDLAGSRIFGPTYGSPFDATYANRQASDVGFTDLDGGGRVDQLVGTANLMWTPLKHLTLVPSFRIEHQEQEGETIFREIRPANAPDPVALVDLYNRHNSRFTDVTGALAARYTGVTNWTFYARAEWLQGQGTLREDWLGTGFPENRSTESDRAQQKYTVGANWYPHRVVNTAVQYYYRMRDNDYDHPVDGTVAPPRSIDLYPAFIREHQFDTHDINARLTLRPFTTVTLVSRYDYQITDYRMRGSTSDTGVALAEVTSAEARTHILSQSAAWAPLSQLYLQGSLSYAMQRTESPAGAFSTVLNADNDYWTGTFTTGWAVCPRADLQAQYIYYRADNYTDNSAVSVPYGAGAEQHGVTATVVTRIRKNLRWKLQYGYFAGHDQLAGGNNDYTAHLVYSSLQYLF